MNCQQGDLAIVCCSTNAENVGLFVDVVQPYVHSVDGNIYLNADKDLWLCRAKGLIRYTSILGEVVLIDEGPIPDACLRPIRPGAKQDVTNTEQELVCS